MKPNADNEFQDDEFRDDKKENLYRKISLWSSLILSTVLTVWYAWQNPPDSPEMRNMRLFFKENIMEVSKFIKLPREEQAEFAKKQKHPFYAKYVTSSEVKREEIRALIHISTDYTPFQYWFNIIFLWIIVFTTVWFLGLMAEGAIILVRQDHAKRRALRQQQKKKVSSGSDPAE